MTIIDPDIAWSHRKQRDLEGKYFVGPAGHGGAAKCTLGAQPRKNNRLGGIVLSEQCGRSFDPELLGNHLLSRRRRGGAWVRSLR